MLFAGRFNFDVRLVFVILAILIAVTIYFLGFDKVIISQISSLGIYGSIIIGCFYTFGLTTPTAMLLIIEMMNIDNYIIVAILASLGAACVDTFFFIMVKQRLEESTKKILDKIRKKIERVNFVFPILGFFVLGSPLPDEIGLALMEITEIKSVNIFVIVFLAKVITLILTFNAIHIV